jgi:hypothetical protein
MVALDSASHDRAKQREQHAPDVFDVREADGPVRLRVDQKLARAREEPVRSNIAMPRQRPPRFDAIESGLYLRRRPARHRERQRHGAGGLGLSAGRGQRRVPLRLALEAGEDFPHRFGRCCSGVGGDVARTLVA